MRVSPGTNVFTPSLKLNVLPELLLKSLWLPNLRSPSPQSTRPTFWLLPDSGERQSLNSWPRSIPSSNLSTS
nr:3-isopropylmalate dehydrogenase A [Cryptococcus tetragattii IND107]